MKSHLCCAGAVHCGPLCPVLACLLHDVTFWRLPSTPRPKPLCLSLCLLHEWMVNSHISYRVDSPRRLLWQRLPFPHEKAWRYVMQITTNHAAGTGESRSIDDTALRTSPSYVALLVRCPISPHISRGSHPSPAWCRVVYGQHPIWRCSGIHICRLPAQGATDSRAPAARQRSR